MASVTPRDAGLALVLDCEHEGPCSCPTDADDDEVCFDERGRVRLEPQGDALSASWWARVQLASDSPGETS